MDDEIKSRHDNHILKLIEKISWAKSVSCKCIFKVKEEIEGVMSKRFKTRLVNRGFTQKEGVDCNDVLYPVVKNRSIRTLLSMVARFYLKF